ncbi:acyl carrier protein [Archangium minus]|uniref:Acyl carrier protein n=2 Tax=Archangium minus TaxID=83450 RepID=A0ABY9WJQ7_9BACT|nr:acyl carrier protein [Archangium minus]
MPRCSSLAIAGWLRLGASGGPIMEAQTSVEPQAVSAYLTRLWSQLLQRDVNPSDDFFDVGGSSLAAIRMVMEVQSAYHIEIDVETFFEQSSINRLTDIIVKGVSQSAGARKQ